MDAISPSTQIPALTSVPLGTSAGVSTQSSSIVSRAQGLALAATRARTLGDAVAVAGGPLGLLFRIPALGAAMLLVWLLWVPVGGLFSLLAYAVTTPGAALVIVGLIASAGRLVARAMAFPASLAVFSLQMEREYASRLRARVDAATVELEARLLRLGAWRGARARRVARA